MDEADKNELIAWSKRGNILTRLTSFVGISQKQNQVSFMTSSSVHGAIVKADHFEQCSISEARIQKTARKIGGAGPNDFQRSKRFYFVQNF